MQKQIYKTLAVTAIFGLLTICASVSAQEANSTNYERGLMYIHSGDTNAAVECFEASIKDYKNIGESYKNIALIKYAEGNILDAIVSLDKSLLAQPNVENYVLQASYYNKYGSKKAALRVINKAINLEPTNAELYEIKAAILKGQGILDCTGGDLYTANELRAGRVEVVKTPIVRPEYKIEPIFNEI